MPDALADSTDQLERLLKQIMSETDPIKYDELGAQIWRDLDQRDQLKSVSAIHKQGKDG